MRRMIVQKAVIPCAGLGTRLFPITKLVPKELLPIGTKPAIQYVVEEAVAAGIQEVIFVCNRSKFSIAEYFRPDTSLRTLLAQQGKTAEIAELSAIESMVTISVVYQEEPKGLGHAVLCAEPAVGDHPLLVMLPDMLLFGRRSETKHLLAVCEERQGAGLLVHEVPKAQVQAYGVIRGGLIAEGIYRIDALVEKPAPAVAPSTLAIVGRYLLPPTIFAHLADSAPGVGGEIQLTDSLNALAQAGPMYGTVCQGTVCDVGQAEGLFAAWRHVRGAGC